MTKPFVTMQYDSNGPPLSDGLRMNSIWRISAVASLLPGIAPFAPMSSAVTHSDAQCFCHVDLRFTYTDAATIAFRLPRWFFSTVEGIYCGIRHFHLRTMCRHPNGFRALLGWRM